MVTGRRLKQLSPPFRLSARYWLSLIPNAAKSGFVSTRATQPKVAI
jgi:hypothetical protein